jgi:hypothetical protein
VLLKAIIMAVIHSYNLSAQPDAEVARAADSLPFFNSYTVFPIVRCTRASQ